MLHKRAGSVPVVVHCNMVQWLLVMAWARDRSGCSCWWEYSVPARLDSGRVGDNRIRIHIRIRKAEQLLEPWLVPALVLVSSNLEVPSV